MAGILFLATTTRCVFTDCAAEQDAADLCTLAFLLAATNSSSSSGSGTAGFGNLLLGLLVCDAQVPEECRNSD